MKHIQIIIWVQLQWQRTWFGIIGFDGTGVKVAVLDSVIL